MPALVATNIVLNYGDRRILDEVSLSIADGERLGIVGRNGCGKSTLMKILAGEVRPEAGTVAASQGTRVGHLSQDPRLDPAKTLREEAASAFDDKRVIEAALEEVYDQMASADAEELELLLRRQARLDHELEALGGHDVDHRIDAVLHGLGLRDERFNVRVSALSGGQKARVALAKLLLREPDVLLLDEPTNHLDIEGRRWLETFLTQEYDGAVVLISHDRRLLDHVVHRIVEVEEGRLIDYPGNYAAFRRLRAERRETQYRAWEKQQGEWRKQEEYIRRFKAGQRAKQAKGRESLLEREKADNAIERPMEMGALRLSLPKADRSGDIVASVRGLGKWYTAGDTAKHHGTEGPDAANTWDDASTDHERRAAEAGQPLVLFKSVDALIERGDRWGVIGPNGAGKTTLVRCLLGEVEATEGTVNLGAKLSIGYFKQTHEGLDLTASVVRYLQGVVRKQRPGEAMSEQAARDLAGAFLFSGQDQEKELGLLSGGERSRAVMAGLMVSGKNVLVLDEPTNHLDIPSAERLEEFLRRPPTAIELALDATSAERTGAYEGTLILISHDRAFLDACCNKLLILDGKGGVEVFLGTYSEWESKARGRSAPTQKPKPGRSTPAPAPAKAPPPAAAGRAASPATKPASSPKPSTPAPAARAPDRPAASARPKPGAAPSPRPAATAPEKKEKSKWSWMRLEQIEEKIAHITRQLADLDTRLADPDVWADHAKANALTDQRDELRVELEGLEAEWVKKMG